MQTADSTSMLEVPDVQRKLKVSRSTVFSLIRSGELRSVLIGGRCRRVPVAALEDYIRSLESEDCAQ
jgi:excisionase family DNA binding protein